MGVVFLVFAAATVHVSVVSATYSSCVTYVLAAAHAVIESAAATVHVSVVSATYGSWVTYVLAAAHAVIESVDVVADVAFN